MTQFNYQTAFSRNLGFVSKAEQEIIAEKTIAIPGMGGVGGHHLHTLVRLGFQNFHIADFDHFDLHNFNRQIGAKMSTLGRSKVDVMRELFYDIAPHGKLTVFSKGVNKDNYSEFLEGIDFVVDGLDVYVIKERIELFDLAHAKNIPVITAAPLGMGTSIICFHPQKMKFSKYFDIDPEMPQDELLVKFLAGVNPKPIFLKYLLHRDEIDIEAGRAPSLHTGVLAATTAIGAEVFKLSLNRKPVKFAPHSSQYDFYLGKHTNSWVPGGNRNIRQRILIKLHWSG